MDAFDAQGLRFVDGVGRFIGPCAPLFELAVRVEEGAEERVVVTGIGQVDGDGLRLRAGRFGLGCGDVEDGTCCDGGAFGVGQGRWAGAHLGRVDLLEGHQCFRG
ncbi:hypothetical protein [Streptomyces sp. MA15]|uniref:hypothetical protein n=1 Tax=Streptomyces sp. MA15 TaxID=3055061 RepID=UPI0025B0D819|nr:hypothetical protein [Streptomyces sp. MA15]MDN3270144.1 hypothetical protein [Streptomyces sp. MA15]